MRSFRLRFALRATAAGTIALLWMSQQAGAGVLYVDRSSDCDPLDPTRGTVAECAYARIAEATAVDANGDTIQVACGNYDETVVLDRSVWLKGAGPHCTSIIGDEGNGINVTGSEVTISRVYITGGGDGISIGTANSETTVRNCVIKGNTGRGIFDPYLAADRLVVENCVITENQGDGVYTHLTAGGSWFWNNIIAYNERGIAADGSDALCRGGWNRSFGNFSDGFCQLPGDDNASVDFVANSLCLDPTPLQPAIDGGCPEKRFNDFDGTRNDQGAYGGPGAVEFAWICGAPGGPVVTDLSVTPAAVPAGGEITIEATGVIPGETTPEPTTEP